MSNRSAYVINLKWSTGVTTNPMDEKTSKKPYSQMRVNCPVCNNNNAMGASHKIGDKVVCGGCGHMFYIGDK